MAVFAESLEARCQAENEDVVGAAPTGDAPTTSDWSKISLPTKVRLILEVLRFILQRTRCLDNSMWGPFTVIQSSLRQVMILVLYLGPLIVGCQCTPQLRWSGKWPWGPPSNSIIFPRRGMGEDIVVYKHIFVCIGISSIETYLQLHTLIIWSNIKQNWTHQESNSDRAWVRIWFNKIPLT